MKLMSIRKSLLRALLACFAASYCVGAISQSYPAKPVRLIVPFPPGAYTDTVARLLAKKLSDGFGQAVVVENRAGAGGNIGADYVAKSAPDGYTLLMGTIASAISVSAYAKLPYQLTRDLAPVSLVVSVPYVLVTGPAIPAKSLGELVELARAQPGKLNYASSGNGSALHLASELFKTRTGIDLVHIPYKGIAPAMTDLVGGQVSVMFPSLDSALPHIRSGKIKALAVTSTKRSPLLPDVPTVAESGLPGFEILAWGGVLAPAGTPKDIVTHINSEIAKALESSDIRKRFLDIGAEATPSTPGEFARFIEAEIEKWAQVVKASGVRID